MKLVELFPEDDLLAERLAEGPIKNALKKTALGGAVAAGLAYGYGAMDKAPASVSSSDQAALASILQDPNMDIVSKKDQDLLGDLIRKDDSNDKKVNKGFPTGLMDLEKADPDTRVSEFVKNFLPYVQAENKRIMATRTRLIAALRELANERPISKQEREWIMGLFKAYGTKSTKELLKRIDTIPPSLAIAQAAIESGWGTADLARSHNVFYGQKSWSKTGGAQGKYGERYRAFETPHSAVGAYMLNLNTNAAYEDFRTERARLRSRGEPVAGELLAPTLGKYSTLGSTYINRLLNLMKTRDLVSLDKSNSI